MVYFSPSSNGLMRSPIVRSGSPVTHNAPSSPQIPHRSSVFFKATGGSKTHPRIDRFRVIARIPGPRRPETLTRRASEGRWQRPSASDNAGPSLARRVGMATSAALVVYSFLAGRLNRCTQWGMKADGHRTEPAPTRRRIRRSFCRKRLRRPVPTFPIASTCLIDGNQLVVDSGSGRLSLVDVDPGNPHSLEPPTGPFATSGSN